MWGYHGLKESESYHRISVSMKRDNIHTILWCFDRLDNYKCPYIRRVYIGNVWRVAVGQCGGSHCFLFITSSTWMSNSLPNKVRSLCLLSVTAVDAHTRIQKNTHALSCNIHVHKHTQNSHKHTQMHVFVKIHPLFFYLKHTHTHTQTPIHRSDWISARQEVNIIKSV